MFAISVAKFVSQKESMVVPSVTSALLFVAHVAHSAKWIVSSRNKCHLTGLETRLYRVNANQIVRTAKQTLLEINKLNQWFLWQNDILSP